MGNYFMAGLSAHREGREQGQAEAKAELAQKLHDWLEDVDGRHDLDWYRHVVEQNFECACKMDHTYDGMDYDYCDYWRRERHRIEDVTEAEWQAYEEKDVRYEKVWAEAIDYHRTFCANETLYKKLRLAGESYVAFVERITP